MSRVLIAYCCNGTLHDGFHTSLMDLVGYETQRGTHSLERTRAIGPYIEDNRNSVVRVLLASHSEWLLFFDHDMVFAPNFMEVLFQEANEERKIIAGFYLTLSDKGNPISSWLVYGLEGRLQTKGCLKMGDTEEVASVGMGGTLIHRSVFEAISEMRAAMPPDNWEWYGRDLIEGVRHGEDVTFCLRAKAAGFPSFGCTRAQLGHLKGQCLSIDTLVKANA